MIQNSFDIRKFQRPLIDSPLWKSGTKLQDHYAELGWVTVPLCLSRTYLNSVIQDMARLIAEDTKTQESGYHYSSSPRIFEGWKKSKYIRELALCPDILNAIAELYGVYPIPFQTINFTHATGQPLHSDEIHFSTEPQGWMCGVWIPLEDVGFHNGSLEVISKSHKFPSYDFTDLGLEIPKYGDQFENYRIYEQFIRSIVKEEDRHSFFLKAGSCAVIWSSNLLHGGGEHIDKENPPSRLSQATHYYFPGCRHYYSPMFSNPRIGLYAEKDLKSKDFYNKDNYES